ncbi:PAS domain S-box protein [bacterium]|nr:PAS domain S-box protein [candidate division CSSED10-310 bacterium]
MKSEKSPKRRSSDSRKKKAELLDELRVLRKQRTELADENRKLNQVIKEREADGKADASDSDQVEKYFGQFIDPKDAQTFRKHSLKILNSVVNSMPDIVYRLNQNGEIVFINETIRNYGYEPDELLGKNIFDIVHPDDIEKARYRINERRTGRRKTQMLELRLIRKDRTPVPFEIRTKGIQDLPIFLISAEGLYSTEFPRAETFIGTQGVARDITEFKLTTAELALAMERLRAVLDAVPGYVSWVSSDLTYIGVNKQLAAEFGKTPEDFEGQKVGFLRGGEDFINFTQDFLRTGNAHEVREVKIKVQPKMKFYIVAARKYLGNQAAVFVGIDISDRIAAEKALEKYQMNLEEQIAERTQELAIANKMLKAEIAERKKREEELLRASRLESIGLLAGGIAHDFNNILTAILGNISIAKRKTASRDPIFNPLDVAEKATARAQELANQLLTFANGGAPVKKTASIGDLIKHSAMFALRGSNVSCQFDIPDELWKADIDVNQVNQVLNNLVINSVQAMPDGGQIEISAENCHVNTRNTLGLPSGRYLKICILDHGSGIPKDHLSKVFDPYFTTKVGGSGLGLAMVYSIMKKHKGRVTLDSDIGEGTTATLFFPAAEPVKKKPKHKKTTRIPESKSRILVMDDEILVRTTLDYMLRDLGYDVTTVVNGMETIEKYQSAISENQPYDLVILDLTIPGGLGGVETARRLLEIDPDVPIVLSSGYSDEPVMADYKRYGFSGYIPKPYKINVLEKIVGDLLK